MGRGGGNEDTKKARREPIQDKIIELAAYSICFLILETLWYAIGNIRTDWLRRGIYVAAITILLAIWLVSWRK